jgi:serine/threonine-protein kinase
MARAHAATAIALDAKLGGPHAALGNLNFIEHNYSAAEREFRKAIDVEPSYPSTYHWYSRVLVTEGRFAEAVATAAKARELDPLSAIISANLGVMQTYIGDYPGADSTFALAVALDPANPVVWMVSAELFLSTKNYARAINVIDTAIGLHHDPSAKLSDSAYRAYALALSGEFSPSRELLPKLKRNNFWTETAMLYVGLSERDSAVAWIARYINEPGNGGAILFLRSPVFNDLHSDSRFQRLLRTATSR